MRFLQIYPTVSPHQNKQYVLPSSSNCSIFLLFFYYFFFHFIPVVYYEGVCSSIKLHSLDWNFNLCFQITLNLPHNMFTTNLLRSHLPWQAWICNSQLFHPVYVIDKNWNLCFKFSLNLPQNVFITNLLRERLP